MTFEVDWTDEAVNGLASIWLSEIDREAIVISTDEVDVLLSTDPLDCGESRGPRQRIFFHDPLIIHFVVYEAEKSVMVTACYLNPRARR